MATSYEPPSNVTVVSGGQWIALKDPATGITYFQSAKGNGSGASVIAGAQKYTGPIIISGGGLTVASGAVASGAYLSGGWPTVQVLSGGTLENSTVVNGYTMVNGGGVSLNNNLVSDNGTVLSGGSSVGDSIIAGTSSGDGGGDTFTVDNGGTITSAYVGSANTLNVSGGYVGGETTVQSGGVLNVAGGYVGGETTVQSGGVLNTNSTNITFPVKVEAGGSLTVVSPIPAYGSGSGATSYKPPSNVTVVSGGQWIALKDPATGITYFQSAKGNGSGASAIAGAQKYTGPIIITGGGLTVASGAVASGAYVTDWWPTVQVLSGGTLENSTIVNGYTMVNGGGVSLNNNLVSDNGRVLSGGSSVGDSIIAGTSSGDGGGDTFTVDNGGTITSAYVGSGSTLNVSGVSVSPTIATGATYNIIAGEAPVCFLPNTMIQTISGPQFVEDLYVGDKIFAYIDGSPRPREIIWIGKAQCTVRPYLPLDQAGYPIRVLKDAVAEGVPFKDLLITAEHCLFFSGKFVPARMLVNGRSIFYDTSITSYDYYHIETEDHSVIMADGMLTESYLNTGNRLSFTQIGKIVSIAMDSKTWSDAAAPLTVSRDVVEPIYRQIEARAEQRVCPGQTKAQILTYDHNLRLVTESGKTIRKLREKHGRVIFMIPPEVMVVRILSNVSRPCDVVGPFLDDRRSLGVLVGDVWLFESNTATRLEAHLLDEELSGWYNIEGGTMRWTDGSAIMNLGNRPATSIALLALQICAAGPYLLTDKTSKANYREAIGL